MDTRSSSNSQQGRPPIATREEAEWYARGMLDRRAPQTEEALRALTDGFRNLPPSLLEYLGVKGYRFFPLSRDQLKYLPDDHVAHTNAWKKIIYLGDARPGTIAHEATRAWISSYNRDIVKNVRSFVHDGDRDRVIPFSNEFVRDAKKLTVASINDEKAKAEAGRMYFGVPSFTDPEFLFEQGDRNGAPDNIRSYGERTAPGLVTRFDRLLGYTQDLLNSQKGGRPWRWREWKRWSPTNEKGLLSKISSRLSKVFSFPRRQNESGGELQQLATAEDLRERGRTKLAAKIPRPPYRVSGRVRVFENGKWSFRNRPFGRGTVQLLNDPKTQNEYLIFQRPILNEDGQATTKTERTLYVANDLYRLGLSPKQTVEVTGAVKRRFDDGLPTPEYSLSFQDVLTLAQYIDPRARAVRGGDNRSRAVTRSPEPQQVVSSASPSEQGELLRRVDTRIPQRREASVAVRRLQPLWPMQRQQVGARELERLDQDGYVPDLSDVPHLSLNLGTRNYWYDDVHREFLAAHDLATRDLPPGQKASHSQWEKAYAFSNGTSDGPSNFQNIQPTRRELFLAGTCWDYAKKAQKAFDYLRDHATNQGQLDFYSSRAEELRGAFDRIDEPVMVIDPIIKKLQRLDEEGYRPDPDVSGNDWKLSLKLRARNEWYENNKHYTRNDQDEFWAAHDLATRDLAPGQKVPQSQWDKAYAYLDTYRQYDRRESDFQEFQPTFDELHGARYARDKAKNAQNAFGYLNEHAKSQEQRDFYSSRFEELQGAFDRMGEPGKAITPTFLKLPDNKEKYETQAWWRGGSSDVEIAENIILTWLTDPGQAQRLWGQDNDGVRRIGELYRTALDTRQPFVWNTRQRVGFDQTEAPLRLHPVTESEEREAWNALGNHARSVGREQVSFIAPDDRQKGRDTVVEVTAAFRHLLYNRALHSRELYFYRNELSVLESALTRLNEPVRFLGSASHEEGGEQSIRRARHLSEEVTAHERFRSTSERRVAKNAVAQWFTDPDQAQAFWANATTTRETGRRYLRAAISVAPNEPGNPQEGVFLRTRNEVAEVELSSHPDDLNQPDPVWVLRRDVEYDLSDDRGEKISASGIVRCDEEGGVTVGGQSIGNASYVRDPHDPQGGFRQQIHFRNAWLRHDGIANAQEQSTQAWHAAQSYASEHEGDLRPADTLSSDTREAADDIREIFSWLRESTEPGDQRTFYARQYDALNAVYQRSRSGQRSVHFADEQGHAGRGGQHDTRESRARGGRAGR